MSTKMNNNFKGEMPKFNNSCKADWDKFQPDFADYLKGTKDKLNTVAFDADLYL